MHYHDQKSSVFFKKYVTPLDIIVFIFVIIITISLLVFSLIKNNGSARVEITTEEGTFLYMLNQNRSLVFQGPLGETIVEIANNAVQVLDSPGRRKICVNSGTISQNGQWLACLPNKVFLRVMSTTQSDKNPLGIDGVSF